MHSAIVARHCQMRNTEEIAKIDGNSYSKQYNVARRMESIIVLTQFFENRSLTLLSIALNNITHSSPKRVP